MKKTGSRRQAGLDPEYGPGAGRGSAVLDAPEEGYAPESGVRGGWMGRGPAPAGALQRGYGDAAYGDRSGTGSAGIEGYGPEAMDETGYTARRGPMRLRFRGLPKSVAGRIVLGTVVFGVIGTVAVAVAGVRHFLLHDPRFVVTGTDDIQIVGAEHLTREQILSVFGADLERNIFRVSLGERKADLERLPWVEHATVMRLLPNQIRVGITERTPVAFVRQGTQIGLVDGGGVLLDMPPEDAGDPHYSFPVLTGLSAADPLSTRAARMEIYRQFVRELDGGDGTGGGEHLSQNLSEVDISNPEDVKALIPSGSTDVLVHFGQEQFLHRYREFEQHLPEWKQQYPKLASADMRYEGQVVLEMQGGAAAAVAGDASAEKAAPVKAANVAAPVQQASASSPANIATPIAKATPAPKQVAAPKVASTPTAPKPVAPAATKPVSEPTILAGGTPAQPVSASVKPPAAKLATMKTVRPAGRNVGKSSGNAKVFAQLAAAHKAELAKAAAKKSGANGSAGAVR